MKKFNINDCIYIRITDEGWRHLQKNVSYNFIKYCIDNENNRVEIDGEIWHKLQAHVVFDLLPMNFGGEPTYIPNILIDEKDITDN